MLLIPLLFTLLLIIFFCMEHNEPVKTTPKDFFLHLFNMFLIYATVISFITAVFQIINILVPDFADEVYQVASYKTTLKAALSFLIVVLPVEIGMAWFMIKNFTANPEQRHVRIRRWLVALTMFVTAVTIIGSFVTLVNHLLDGEVTLRFGLKLLAMLVVSSAVFAYFFWDMRTHKTT